MRPSAVRRWLTRSALVVLGLSAAALIRGFAYELSLPGVGDRSAAWLMEPGPSTTRPHTDPDELARQLQRSGAGTAILTTPEGDLIGVVRRTDLPNGL
jgi:hypothetical protein